MVYILRNIVSCGCALRQQPLMRGRDDLARPRPKAIAQNKTALTVEDLAVASIVPGGVVTEMIAVEQGGTGTFIRRANFGIFVRAAAL